MPETLIELLAPAWTAPLARRLETAAAAIARLDARISASPVASSWTRRASLAGLAKALNGQRVEIDEIDIFTWQTGVTLPGRKALTANVRDELGTLAEWRARLDDRHVRHWREDLPFSLTLPADWDDRPLLLRALALTERHARIDATIAPWLALPLLLQRLGVTKTPLPCLVPADPALRGARANPEASALRYLRGIADLAVTGLDRLDAMEDFRRRAATALGLARRPASLMQLVGMLAGNPAVTPIGIAKALNLTISGAGKLLNRAAALGLLVEVTGRLGWRVYLVSDLAIAYGFVTRPRGRPRSPRLPEPGALDRLLSEFDAAVAGFDERMGGSSAAGDINRPAR